MSEKALTTNVPVSTDAVAEPRSSQLSLQQQQKLWGWIFLSPWIIGFLVFTLFPMLASFYFSFTDYRIGSDPKWSGLDNWKQLFSDELTWDSLQVTFRFGILMLPVSILVPLGLATLLNSKFLGAKRVLRALFYMPFVVPAISGVYIWQNFLNGQTGLLNRILIALGMSDPPDWLFNVNYLHPAMVMIGLWGVGNAMLTMLAGMQGVPTELYEAARVDGAGPVVNFRSITLPLISPVILYNLVLTVIGLMQFFILPFVLSNATRTNPEANFINLHLYRTAFQFFDMGYASAIAWFLFAVAMLMTLGVLYSSRRWVYYAGG